jgi:hypothetical protein
MTTSLTDADVTELDNGWEVHSPVGVRLAQVIHHGTDHQARSVPV